MFSGRSPSLVLLLSPAGARALDVVKLPAGTGVAALAVAADGTAWFSAQFSGAVGRVSPSGEVVLFEFPSRGTQPLGLALHPTAAPGRPTSPASVSGASASTGS